jgi:hypothetical protein
MLQFCEYLTRLNFGKRISDYTLQFSMQQSPLGGVIVSALVIRPKDGGFKTGQGGAFLGAKKVRSKSSFGEKVKMEAPCKIFTACKKLLASMQKNTSQCQVHHSLRPFLLLATRSRCS